MTHHKAAQRSTAAAAGCAPLPEATSAASAAAMPISIVQKTVAGCTCTSVCAATLTEKLANCDWCYTADGCGRQGILGSYDYCTYPAIPSYESQTAAQKLDFLWKYVAADQSRFEPDAL